MPDPFIEIAEQNWLMVHKDTIGNKPANNVTLMNLIGDLLTAIQSLDERVNRLESNKNGTVNTDDPTFTD